MKRQHEENQNGNSETRDEPKLTARKERFVEAIVDPQTGTQTEAAIKAGYSPKTARIKASQKLAKVNIRQTIEKRKGELAQAANVTNEAIIGAAAFTTFGSIDDVLDEKGHFDIEKARRTGAIHLIKSIKRTCGRYGESVSIELYSASDARKELAEYRGIKQLPRENDEKLRAAVAGILRYLEIKPDADIDYVIAEFSRARHIAADMLKEKVFEARGETLHCFECLQILKSICVQFT